jgi:hypothetical protein
MEKRKWEGGDDERGREEDAAGLCQAACVVGVSLKRHQGG